jgi:hypothetical protein
LENYEVYYLPDGSYSYGGGSLTYIGPDKDSNPIDVEVDYYNHNNKKVSSDKTEGISKDLSIRLGKNSGNTKNLPSFNEIKKWYLVVKWDGIIIRSTKRITKNMYKSLW